MEPYTSSRLLWRGGLQASWEEVESEFWRLVEEGEEQVEVLMAVDLDSAVYGTGFPRCDGSAAPPSPYAVHKWNLNNLPRLEGPHPSLLRHVSAPLPGLTTPWLQVGMMFSSTTWHLEEHLMYDVSYNHLGDPRRCYAVPNSHRAAFEAAVRDAMPAGASGAGDGSQQLMLAQLPRALRAAGVLVYSVTQAAGEFVVTWPGAYHAAVGLGVHVEEHISMAPPDWLRFAEEAERRQRLSRRKPAFNQQEMLLHAARGECSPSLATFLVPELCRVIEQEHRLRLALWEQGTTQLFMPCEAVQALQSDPHECAVCRSMLHLSGVECCRCPAGRIVCLHHAGALCGCPPDRRRLAFRHSIKELHQVRLPDLVGTAAG
ncbi:hypothetical protein VOLCADRAFT_57805 [Volvox carteri f. nagariensis]|uniref:JmjC domain-containing protein n=1 Tax=Volvox carteri f. nagariensis TaxID=3068 RepID=D8TNQ1_VOLCA|nr:uncharacterized protein VOLCADRAFT_57805 [Volvox carteri f. nagariensis]EFJ51032.1 hypothetical protein VOLCADRAFT_57805 [Volvox carteri f. nagariensis]|eukprot:XP_002948044.1 hypothetical protein VOLCADRAFT_57805 [Volvox carteri f. nagariensis]